MILESVVRQRLAAVASHALSLEDFADWIDEASWNMHSDSSPDAIDLVSSIHALLAERDDRAINDEALRRELLSLLNNVHVSVVSPGRAAASRAHWVRPAQPWALPASA
jgi:hypothetical protein